MPFRKYNSTEEEIIESQSVDSQNTASVEDENFLESGYNYLAENLPPMLSGMGDYAMDVAGNVAEGIRDFTVGAPDIPTLRNDLSPEPVQPYSVQLERARAAEVAKLPGYQAAAIGTARELSKLGQGITERSGVPPQLQHTPTMGFSNPNDPTLQEVESQFPISHGVGATIPYFAPGPAAPLKKLGVDKIPTYKLARQLYHAGEKAPTDFLKKNIKGAAIDLRLAPKAIANSPFANIMTTGAAAGYVHPEMTAPEGMFYTGMGYGLGKMGYGKFGRPKNYNLPEKNELVKWGKSRGYDIDPGVQTGDISMQQRDQAFLRNAQTSGPFFRAQLTNREKNNRIVSRLIGRETNNLDSEFFETTGKQLNARRDELYGMLKPSHNSALHRRTNKVLTDYESTYGPQNLAGQYNPNWDPTVKLYVDKIWDMFKRPSNDVPIELWRGVRDQLDDVLEVYSKTQGKQHLVKPLTELSDILDDMLTGNKKTLGQLKRNKLQRAVRWHTMSTQTSPGEVNMDNLANLIQKKYPSQLRGVEKTGNVKLDDFYNAIKLHKAMQDTHGASLSVSDKISKLFTNPGAKSAGKIGYLFSKDLHDVGPINSFIINRYRNSPGYGLPNRKSSLARNLGMGPITTDELIGAITGRYALSEK